MWGSILLHRVTGYTHLSTHISVHQTMDNQGRRNSPGCPGNGLGTFRHTPFCACAVSNATIVRIVVWGRWSLICANSTILAIRWKTPPSGSFQLSQERIWKTSCGKAKFSRRLVSEMNVATSNVSFARSFVRSYACEGVQGAKDACKKCIWDLEASHHSISSARIKWFP